jgi:hypothetical protein
MDTSSKLHELVVDKTSYKYGKSKGKKDQNTTSTNDHLPNNQEKNSP